MIEVNIDLQKLRAIQLLAARNDIRPTLNGVHVEATAKATRLMATTGHYLGMLDTCNPLEVNKGCEWETFILPNDLIDRCKLPDKSMSQIGTVLIDPARNDGVSEYVMRLWDGTRLPFTPIDGKTPDMRRVIPSSEPDDIAGQLNPDYFALFAKVAKALGSKAPDRDLKWSWYGGRICRLHVATAPEFIGICMGKTVGEPDPRVYHYWAPMGAEQGDDNA